MSYVLFMVIVWVWRSSTPSRGCTIQGSAGDDQLTGDGDDALSGNDCAALSQMPRG